MELLAPAKKTYMLEAPLEILHQESLEWLEEIEFWKDEVAFFCTLILRKTKKTTSLLQAKEAKSIENHLVYISAEKLDDLKMEVQAHEHFLSKMMEDVKQDEKMYRSKHRDLSKKFQDFENGIKVLKMKIFQLIETNKK